MRVRGDPKNSAARDLAVEKYSSSKFFKVVLVWLNISTKYTGEVGSKSQVVSASKTREVVFYTSFNNTSGRSKGRENGGELLAGPANKPTHHILWYCVIKPTFHPDPDLCPPTFLLLLELWISFRLFFASSDCCPPTPSPQNASLQSHSDFSLPVPIFRPVPTSPSPNITSEHWPILTSISDLSDQQNIQGQHWNGHLKNIFCDPIVFCSFPTYKQFKLQKGFRNGAAVTLDLN